MSLQSEHADSILLSGNFPISGMTVDGVLYPLQKSELPILENDGSFWPTPVANDDNKSPEAHMAMKARMPGGPRKKCTSLNVMVKGIEKGLWPTPRASANENRQTKPTPSQLAGKHGLSLAAQVGGYLNPTWVEWLMGYPPEWTVLEDWAMQWFRSKRKQRSKD
jgi:hypothetical protein